MDFSASRILLAEGIDINRHHSANCHKQNFHLPDKVEVRPRA